MPLQTHWRKQSTWPATELMGSEKMTKKKLAKTMKRADKLELFCQAYVGTLGNGRQAYIMAGYASGKNGASADTGAWESLRLPEVRERIRAIMAENHNGIMMTADETIREVSMIARGDIGNVFDEDGNLLQIQDMDLPTRLNVSEFEVTKLGDSIRVTKLKFGRDKMAALEKLMKFYSMYEEDKGEGGVFRTYHKVPQDALV